MMLGDDDDTVLKSSFDAYKLDVYALGECAKGCSVRKARSQLIRCCQVFCFTPCGVARNRSTSYPFPNSYIPLRWKKSRTFLPRPVTSLQQFCNVALTKATIVSGSRATGGPRIASGENVGARRWNPPEHQRGSATKLMSTLKQFV